jgi:iron complex transport system substrate-binding protein
LKQGDKAMNSLIHLILAVMLLSGAASGRTVRDEFGRDMKVPDHPHRLICLAPSITDTVYALGAGADIVGITDYTKYPPEAKQKPSVGGVINPSLERIVALKPDLVLAIGDLNSLDLVSSIERLGFTVFVVHPHGIEGIYRSIESIGRAINEDAKASALVARLRVRERIVRERVAGKAKPTVFFLVWSDPIMTAGRGAFITELIEIAGAKSISDDLPHEWPQMSSEAVLFRQPEYLVLTRESNVDLAQLQRQSWWKKLRAAQDGKIIYADDRIIYPSPIAFDALEDLAKQLHP